MDNMLYAGASKYSITPPEDIRHKLAGISPNTDFSVIDNDGLYVRVIVIKNDEQIIMFIHYELDQAPFPHKMIEIIYRKYGIPEENIFLLGNHSHEVPLTGVRAAEERHNMERAKEEHYEATLKYESLVLEAATYAVSDAMEHLKPARIGWGEGVSDINTHAFTRNHLNIPDRPVLRVMPLDKTLFVMRLETETGEPIAFLINYSAHNNCVHVPNILSADVEGYISRLIEEQFPGSIAMWTLAAHGDISMRGDYWNVHFFLTPPKFADPADTLEETIRCERILALRQFEDVLKVLDLVECKEMPSVSVTAAVDYVDLPSEDPIGYHLRLHIVRFGNLVFIGNGGKLYNSFKLLMRSMLPVNMYGICLSQDCCDDSTVTYVFDERKLNEEIYEGKKVFVRPEDVTNEVKNTFRRMCKSADIVPLG